MPGGQAVSVTILRANALALPLADESVDLVVTSPPYFGLRSYQDGGEHYEGQIGDEPTPAEFVDALIAVTAECMRVLKPSGSLWVNLGDKYAGSAGSSGYSDKSTLAGFTNPNTKGRQMSDHGARKIETDVRAKSLIGIPWRYALRCIDDLGLILRAEVIWSKPNGLPESVTDRVRRSHETWFHFTLSPRYYSAVDAIREEHVTRDAVTRVRTSDYDGPMSGAMNGAGNPLGKLPGSVWTIPTQPLRVPDHLGIDHFAAFPMEWPRRLILGWSPREVCTACGEGRRPVVAKSYDTQGRTTNGPQSTERRFESIGFGVRAVASTTITGYACACPDVSAPATPGVVLDPFGGTGTTALVADVLGRDAITVDLSADYCRLAQWRTSDPKQRAKAARVEAAPEVPDGQADLFEDAS